MGRWRALPRPRPSLTAATSSKTSRLEGAALEVTIKRSTGEANLREVAVTLPGVLPSRNSTLLRACTEAELSAGGLLSCPKLSRVGSARLDTPLLPQPLTGPGILVSHGGAPFPDLDLVLQGDGLTLIEESHTDIRNGVTSSTFSALPDAPFKSFTATFPRGGDSLLSSNGSLCTRTVVRRRRVTLHRHGHLVLREKPISLRVARALVMPATLVAQHGARRTQSTRIAVAGCAGVPARRVAKPQHVRRAPNATGPAPAAR